MASIVTKVLTKAVATPTKAVTVAKSKVTVSVASTVGTPVMTNSPPPAVVGAARTTRALPGSQNVVALQIGKGTFTGGANGANGTAITGQGQDYTTYY